ncbi:hypothetical protein PENSPDRAFT_671965 [Peniophora sp. CONT]|nr:hypothetical protein PENSPDRAFT_671965 [Peniophora sp. CONT]
MTKLFYEGPATPQLLPLPEHLMLRGMSLDECERAREAFGLLPDGCTVLAKKRDGTMQAVPTRIVCQCCLSDFRTLTNLLHKKGKVYERINPRLFSHLDGAHGVNHIPSINSANTINTMSSLQTGGGDTELLVTGNGDGEDKKKEEDQDQEGNNKDNENNDEEEPEISTDVDALVADFERVHSAMQRELAGLTPVCSNLVNNFNAAVSRLSAKKTHPLLWRRETDMALSKVTRIKQLLGALVTECSTAQASVGARLLHGIGDQLVLAVCSPTSSFTASAACWPSRATMAPLFAAGAIGCLTKGATPPSSQPVQPAEKREERQQCRSHLLREVAQQECRPCSPVSTTLPPPSFTSSSSRTACLSAASPSASNIAATTSSQSSQISRGPSASVNSLMASWTIRLTSSIERHQIAHAAGSDVASGCPSVVLRGGEEGSQYKIEWSVDWRRSGHLTGHLPGTENGESSVMTAVHKLYCTCDVRLVVAMVATAQNVNHARLLPISNGCAGASCQPCRAFFRALRCPPRTKRTSLSPSPASKQRGKGKQPAHKVTVAGFIDSPAKESTATRQDTDTRTAVALAQSTRALVDTLNAGMTSSVGTLATAVSLLEMVAVQQEQHAQTQNIRECTSNSLVGVQDSVRELTESVHASHKRSLIHPLNTSVPANALRAPLAKLAHRCCLRARAWTSMMYLL